MEKLKNLFSRKKKAKKDAKDFETTDHQVELSELYARFGVDPVKGLSSEAAAQKLEQYGRNQLTPPKVTPVWLLFLKTMFSGFNVLLWLGCTASCVCYAIEYSQDPWDAKTDNLYLGIVLGVVVFVTAIFQFTQERKSSTIMKSFAEMIPPKAKVLRDGKVSEIKAVELVPGDIVHVEFGDTTPADLRIIEARGMKVDNSSLTGENEPIARKPECTAVNPMETRNLAFFGTNIVEGTGVGLVILTGDKTAMGNIAGLTHKEAGKAPIHAEMHNFIRIIGIVAVGIGLTFFAISLLYKYHFLEALVFLIGIIVANVPEGIVCTVTICLTLTAVKMRKKNCLVKNLEAVETLGSTSTICSDKTGTLTQNKMTVTHFWFPEGKATYCAPGENIDPNGTTALAALIRSATLCSRADFKDPENKSVEIQKREATGDASEIAILRFCERTTGDVHVMRQANPKVAEIPFNSANKYQVSIHKRPKGPFLLVMKGAPEQIYARCSTYSRPGLPDEPVSSDFAKSFEKVNAHLGKKGERVLGFCDFELDPEKFPPDFTFDTEVTNFPLTGLRFLGVISMIDPPRPGVPEAVKLCQNAGIRVAMVTGDHPITATAIAKQVNIIRENAKVTLIVEDKDRENFRPCDGDFSVQDEALVIHGEQLKKLTDKELENIVRNHRQVVFARTSPVQKLIIVTAYQSVGKIVAVTGDGVNDAPALSKAHIGIAMGITGTEVSKSAADMILLNDNFTSIVTAVEEGRLIFDNLKKSIAYTLTSNVPELTPFLVYVVFGLPLPMSIIAILCIDLGTDMWPAISYAYEVAESDIMQRPPRDPKYDRLVNFRLLRYSYLQIGFIQGMAGFMTYAAVMADNGFRLNDLYNLRLRWEDKGINDLTDSFGQEWSFEERKCLEKCCHAAFFYAIVVVQWADLIASKMRTNSIVAHGFANKALNMGMLSTVLLCVFLLYTPFVNQMFALMPLRLRWCLIAIPYAFLIFTYDEMRRYWNRLHPQGLVFNETFY
uniref:Sodium/potassium-transporting ATPase subunit alpha n=1 Tax=Panagrellus redivivus TaxID=6233 RepID=A0A7E4ZUQ9_PANRE